MLRNLLAFLALIAWHRAIVPAIVVAAAVTALGWLGFVSGAIAGLW